MALTIKDAIQQLRAGQRPLSPAQQADALSKVQDYLDALQSDLISVEGYLLLISTGPGIPIPADTVIKATY